MSLTTTSGEPSNAAEEWIELNEPKHLSRLLYTNPVCFLSICTPDCRNVMVLSWLTATNNQGRFMFSLNRRRHSASLLSEGSVFSLSVPVKGMESLVREVGGTSGKWGSKFLPNSSEELPQAIAEQPVNEPPLLVSKRQAKKKQRNSPGISGLQAVPCGMRTSEESNIIAIDGTVAHLQCRVYSMMKEAHVIDDEHYLVFCEVTRAFVHASYWDSAKSLFRPRDESPPYLTFFGSQTFGYVVTK